MAISKPDADRNLSFNTMIGVLQSILEERGKILEWEVIDKGNWRSEEVREITVSVKMINLKQVEYGTAPLDSKA